MADSSGCGGGGRPSDETADELLQALGELQIAEEELRQQREELAGTHDALEEERRRTHKDDG